MQMPRAESFRREDATQVINRLLRDHPIVQNARQVSDAVQRRQARPDFVEGALKRWPIGDIAHASDDVRPALLHRRDPCGGVTASRGTADERDVAYASRHEPLGERQAENAETSREEPSRVLGERKRQGRPK